MPDDDETMLPTRQTADRYHRTIRSIERWVADPRLGFPPPIVIRGRKFWRLGSLRDWERQRAAPSSGASGERTP